jgi:hypothetical protein
LCRLRSYLPRGPRVGVAEGVLDVLQSGAEPEGPGGVGVAKAVRGDAGGQADVAAEPAKLGVGEPVAIGAFAAAADEDAAAGAGPRSAPPRPGPHPQLPGWRARR